MNKIFILISFFYLTYTVNAVKPKEEIENISIIWEKCQSTFFCENVEKNLQKKNAILYFSNLSETYKPYWIRSLLLLCKHFYTLHGNNIELMLDLIDYHWNDNKDLFYSEYLSMKVGDNHYIISDKDISEKMSNLSLVHEIFFSLNDGFSKAKDGFHRASLLFDNETFKYLYNDDIENFSLIFNTTNFSQKTKNLLLSYSILFSSVKCFKFIFLNLESNLHQIQGTMRLATLSGNLEIIRICEQNGCLPDRYTYSIFSDINEWLIDVRGLDDWDLTCNLIRAKEIGAACSLI